MNKNSTKKIAAKDADQYMLRLPPGLRDRVAQRAADSGRSMNTEIVAAIEQYLTGADRVTHLWQLFRKHEQNIEAIHFVLLALWNLDDRVSKLTHSDPMLASTFGWWRQHEREMEALPLITADQAQTIKALLHEINVGEQSLLVWFRVNRIEDIRGFEQAKGIIGSLKASQIRTLLKDSNTDEKNFLSLMGVARIEDIRSFEQAKDIIERIRQSRTPT